MARRETQAALYKLSVREYWTHMPDRARIVLALLGRHGIEPRHEANGDGPREEHHISWRLPQDWSPLERATFNAEINGPGFYDYPGPPCSECGDIMTDTFRVCCRGCRVVRHLCIECLAFDQVG
jgi:hypothetical protein